MQKFRRTSNSSIGLSSLFCLVLAFGCGNAKLRGILSNFDALKELATNPIIGDDIRGKTLKELGVVEQQATLSGSNTKTIRRTQVETSTGGLMFSYFAVGVCRIVPCTVWYCPRILSAFLTSDGALPFLLIHISRQVYDEFGPELTNLGDTAGIRGTIYDHDARENGLLEEYVTGSLQATCTIVASKGSQLCSYEIFMLDAANGSIGTLVATGSLNMELNKKHLLIIEATGDDYVDFGGGLLGITYKAKNKQVVIEIDIMF